MHDRFDTYSGASADEHVYMAETAAEQMRLVGPHVDAGARVAAWDEFPDGRSPSSPTVLRPFDHSASGCSEAQSCATAVPCQRPSDFVGI